MSLAHLDSAAFDTLTAQLDQSWYRAGGASQRASRTALIGGRSLSLRSTHTTLVDLMWPALEHHDHADGDADLEIRAWVLPDGPRPTIPVSAVRGRECVTLDGDEVIGRLRFDATTGTLMAWDPARRVAWWCTAALDTIPWWDRAAPFKTVLSWWLSGAGLAVAHCSAVGDDHGAVLLVGRGGSGKSTTAVSCHLGGMGYVGDDLCLVEPGERAVVHSLFGSAKLMPHEFDALDPLRPHLLEVDRRPGDKLVAVVTRRPGAHILRSAPVVAVAAVSVGDEAATVVEETTAGDVLTALAPSSMLPVPGSSAASLAVFAAMLRTVPLHRVRLGHDRAAVVAAVRSMLTGVSSVR